MLKAATMSFREVEQRSSPSVVIAGHWRWDIYEEALASGFRANGWQVIPFKLDESLVPGPTSGLLLRLKMGPAVRKMNRDLIHAVEIHSPSAVLFYATDLIFPSTLDRIKSASTGTVVLLYHNDNPFAGLRNRVKWRHYLGAVPKADAVLVYRPVNLDDARRHGAKRVALLPPHYLTYRHRPVALDPGHEPDDLIFIGHYEDDGRVELLDYLVRNGIRVSVYGPTWGRPAARYPWIDPANVRQVPGEEYSRLLSSARMALALLSSSNRDVWTRRCFEIPACRVLMLAPRTKALETLFTDGREVVFFDSRDDLLLKIRHYLANDSERERIAEAGWKRCVDGEHHEIGRARLVARIIEEAATQ